MFLVLLNAFRFNPEVSIRNEYSAVHIPEPSANGGRAMWPVDMKGFQVELPAFMSHLANDKNQGTTAQDDMLRGMTRVFHMLEVEGIDLSSTDQAGHNLQDLAWQFRLPYQPAHGYRRRDQHTTTVCDERAQHRWATRAVPRCRLCPAAGI
jgi:hypothetical protein